MGFPDCFPGHRSTAGPRRTRRCFSGSAATGSRPRACATSSSRCAARSATAGALPGFQGIKTLNPGERAGGRVLACRPALGPYIPTWAGSQGLALGCRSVAGATLESTLFMSGCVLGVPLLYLSPDPGCPSGGSQQRLPLLGMHEANCHGCCLLWLEQTRSTC